MNEAGGVGVEEAFAGEGMAERGTCGWSGGFIFGGEVGLCFGGGDGNGFGGGVGLAGEGVGVGDCDCLVDGGSFEDRWEVLWRGSGWTRGRWDILGV